MRKQKSIDLSRSALLAIEMVRVVSQHIFTERLSFLMFNIEMGRIQGTMIRHRIAKVKAVIEYYDAVIGLTTKKVAAACTMFKRCSSLETKADWRAKHVKITVGDEDRFFAFAASTEFTTSDLTTSDLIEA